MFSTLSSRRNFRSTFSVFSGPVRHRWAGAFRTGNGHFAHKNSLAGTIKLQNRTSWQASSAPGEKCCVLVVASHVVLASMLCCTFSWLPVGGAGNRCTQGAGHRLSSCPLSCVRCGSIKPFEMSRTLALFTPHHSPHVLESNLCFFKSLASDERKQPLINAKSWR